MLRVATFTDYLVRPFVHNSKLAERLSPLGSLGFNISLENKEAVKWETNLHIFHITMNTEQRVNITYIIMYVLYLFLETYISEKFWYSYA